MHAACRTLLGRLVAGAVALSWVLEYLDVQGDVCACLVVIALDPRLCMFPATVAGRRSPSMRCHGCFLSGSCCTGCLLAQNAPPVLLGGERIEFAKVDDNEPRLADLLDRWKAVGYPLSGLKCFRIETSSTGSVILIYARTWRIEHLSMADAVP